MAAQVARFPDRLVGACSVNPLRGYAIDEVRRCAADPRLRGLKLHFANSDVDLRDPEHVAQLQAVFRVAGELELPIVVHMRTRAPDYGMRDVRVFIEDLLSRAPGLPVQIAHMAGWGGYDEATDEALGTFLEAFRAGGLDKALYTFDLAAVILPPERAGPEADKVAEMQQANTRLAGRIRELGTEHVLFASDWDALPMVGTLTSLREHLPLDEHELTAILDNVGPLLR